MKRRGENSKSLGGELSRRDFLLGVTTAGITKAMPGAAAAPPVPQSCSTPSIGTVLWEIGTFNQSSFEFKRTVDFNNPNDKPVFTVGKSKAEKDWPALQPGSENKDLGGRPHPYTILFDLPQAPRGRYTMTVSTLLYSARIPNLLVELNGQKGLFYFDRKLSYYPGDLGAYSPIYGKCELVMALPTAAFRQGQNKIVLTALDDPKDGPSDSELHYDAMRLTQENGAESAPKPSVRVEPTVFYKEEKGALHEITEVTATVPSIFRSGKIELFVGGVHLQASFDGNRDFGEYRVELNIPDLSKPGAATVRLSLDGKESTFHVEVKPKRKWTLYFVPHEHLDVGFTDYQAKVADVHNRNIDKLVGEIREHPEMRFNLDGSWIAKNYLATRNATAQGEFLTVLREGKIALPSQEANVLTGYATLEELIRSKKYSYCLHREHGVPFDYANMTDIPSYSWSYASILNAMGVKYFAAASNNDRAPILLYGRWNEKSPFWWRGPDGNKVLMAYTRQYSQLWFTCGLPPQEASARQSFPTYFQAYESPDYKPDIVLLYGSQFENTDLIPGEAPFVKKWNAEYAYPKFVITTFPEYFRTIEKNFGSDLETVISDGGPYWEDGLGSDACYGAIDRANQQRALSAEKSNTIATYLVPTLAAPRDLIDRMWSQLVLFAEHTWTYWGGCSRPESEESVGQLRTKDHRVEDSYQLADSLLEQSLSEIANQIHMPAESLVVFNSLNWKRSDLLEIDLDDGMTVQEHPGMKDLPVEILRRGPGYDHVRFLASDVPSLGFKCYQITRGPRPASPAPEETSEFEENRSLENDFYRIEVDTSSGAIQSLYDKELKREIVNASSPYRLNQYLYVAGGDEMRTQIVYMSKGLPYAKLSISSSADGRILRRRETPYGQILTVASSGLHAPLIETDIILFDHEKKILLINRLRKQPVTHKEAVYFAFPFAIENPVFNYEIQNGWVDPSRNMLKGAGLEWFTTQHWVKVAGQGVEVGLVPVDAPLVTLGDINRGRWPEEFSAESATVFSYVINNYWHTNFRRVQGGDFTFRYALTSGRSLAPEGLAQFGRAAMTPLEVNEVIKNDKWDNPARPLPSEPTSFLEVDASNVSVENWKVAEDGQGTVLRLLEVGGKPATAQLHFPHPELRQAWVTTAMEVNQREIPVQSQALEVSLKPHEIITLRIQASKTAG
jgi:alpha-mannosidase